MFTQVSERHTLVGHHGGEVYHRSAGDLLWHQQQKQQQREQQGKPNVNFQGVVYK
jgi:hypothetical protein